MARIKLLTREEMNEEQKELYDRFPSNLVKGLLLTGNVSKGYEALGAALRYTKLSARIREFAIIRIAYLSCCEYVLMQHRNLALEQGLSLEDMEAIANNHGKYFDDKMSVILQFVNECVEQVKVSAATYKETQKYLGDEEIAELTILIGHYMMTARFLETLEIDLDDKPTSWDKV